MIDLGLSAAELRELYALLIDSHQVEIRLEKMTLNHKFLGDISHTFQNGSVTIDDTTDVTRSMSLLLLDPGGKLNLDPEDPDEGAMYPTTMIRCIYMVGRPDNSKWFEIPLFTGPVNKVERDGIYLNIECLGKESLSGNFLWKAKTFVAGWNKAALIKHIMAAFSGETKFDFITVTAKTGQKLTMKRGAKTVWAYSKRLARSMNMHLFYDGRGTLRLRRRPRNIAWNFTEECLLSQPKVGYSIDGLVNAIDITGALPKGAKRRIRFVDVAKWGHPLSPLSLSRNGINRYFTHVEKNDDLQTLNEARDYGTEILENGLLESVTVSATSVVIPILEEQDVFAIQTRKFATSSRIRQLTIPLLVTDTMSVGYTKGVALKKRR